MQLFNRASVVFSLQTWLAETPEQKKVASTPGYFSVGMACEYALGWNFVLDRWLVVHALLIYGLIYGSRSHGRGSCKPQLYVL